MYWEGFTDYSKAEGIHLEIGGWLLDLGNGVYAVIEDEEIIRDMRGDNFIAHCEAINEWDETKHVNHSLNK